jgi:hypothetical protein
MPAWRGGGPEALLIVPLLPTALTCVPLAREPTVAEKGDTPSGTVAVEKVEIHRRSVVERPVPPRSTRDRSWAVN